MITRTGALAVAAAVAALAAVSAPPAALGAAAASLHGTVMAAGKPLGGAQVTLFAGSREGVSELGHARTDTSGSFGISYVRPAAGVLYVQAAPAGASRLRLQSVVGAGSGGGVRPQTLTTVTVDELTTVATAYALAQFSGPNGIAGPSPGLENAAATAFSLADPASGKAGAVVTDQDNGGKNRTLATLGTLANLVSLCAAAHSAGCAELLRLTAPPGGTIPGNTVQAVLNLARNPTLSPAGLYALAQTATAYQPALTAPPTAWILALLYTDTDLYASGRIAIDAKGNVWSNNNWLPGTKNPSLYMTVLNPVGQPTLGSPISGGGMKGGAWGAAIAPDGSVWADSFGGAAMSQYSAAGVPLSPGTGWTNGDLNHPQGVAVDQKGNVWIANNYGPESAPGQGNVVVYPGGDPSKAFTISGSGLNHPFAVQIDGYGRAWVTNAGLGGAKLVNTRAAILVGKFGGSITVIGPDFKPVTFSPIQSSSFKWPLGLAIDSKNNAWVASYFSSTVTEIRPSGAVAGVYHLPKTVLPWSEAVDGSDRVWVAGFGTPRVWLLCGADTAACPPGSAAGTILSPRPGFQSAAFQHFTSIQIDQSGNLWLSNNWSALNPPAGGTGIAEIVGAATPVCTPLTPVPVRPSSSAATACARQAMAPLAAGPPVASAPPTAAAAGISKPGGTPGWGWAAIATALAVLAAAAVLFFRRRFTRSLPARHGWRTRATGHATSRRDRPHGAETRLRTKPVQAWLVPGMGSAASGGLAPASRTIPISAKASPMMAGASRPCP